MRIAHIDQAESHALSAAQMAIDAVLVKGSLCLYESYIAQKIMPYSAAKATNICK